VASSVLGFELVKRRKPRGEPATLKDWARVEFTPLAPDKDRNPKETFPPTDATLLSCGFPARMAYATMLRTKEELIDGFNKLDGEDIDKTLTCMAEAAETLKAIVYVLDSAHTRVLVAASAQEIAKGKARGASKRRAK
jgi:hypothetical protein